MKTEFFDVVNEMDNVIGRASREEVHECKLLHRAVHIWIFDAAGRLLLQKRALTKDRHPGAWDCSCSGHVDSGEDYDTAAIRELKEELGITVDKEYLRLMDYVAASDLTDQEFIRVYGLRHDGTFVPEPSEISELRWWPTQDVLSALCSGEEKFATAFSNIAPKHL